MRRLLILTSCTVCVAIVSYYAARIHTQTTFFTKRAFTAYVQRSSRSLLNGNSFVGYSLDAFRTDGSKVEANLDDYPKLTNSTRGIWLVPEKKYVVVTDRVQSLATHYLSKCCSFAADCESKSNVHS